MTFEKDPIKSRFQSEADLEIYARQAILSQGDDHEELLCSQTPTMNRNDLRSASSDSLNMLLYDCAAFCCSFQEKRAGAVTGDGVGALATTFS